MTTQERRDRFLMILSARRKVTVRELMQEIHVCRSTVLRDIEYLTSFDCFYTVEGRSGGIFADDSWHYKPPVLTPAMESALGDILVGKGPDKDVIICILQAFGTKKNKSS